MEDITKVGKRRTASDLYTDIMFCRLKLISIEQLLNVTGECGEKCFPPNQEVFFGAAQVLHDVSEVLYKIEAELNNAEFKE